MEIRWLVEFCHGLWLKRSAFEFAPWFIGWKEKVSAGVRLRGGAPGRQWLWCQCSCSEVEPMSIEAADFRDMAFPSFLVLLRLWSYTLISFVTAGICNWSKWEADIWGWFEVRRSAMLHFNERQRPHWACWQYGHTGGTWWWLGVERWQLCLRDTSRSPKCHQQAAVGHWTSVCVKCCRMVDSVSIKHYISIL